MTAMFPTGRFDLRRPCSSAKAGEAAAEFEKEQKRREAERRREEVARERDLKRREKVGESSRGAGQGRARDAKKAADLQAEAGTVEKSSRAEDGRWERERERLQAAVRWARD
ncbi:hypothetical protein [Bradyrhizobium jicamae]|uniref:hypothetical protein n=1 Tax=Bradyrhizobium jicamae TaxID=280332 RepID=UPI001BAE12EE|nr:hypothetical protein [Bradyrhizobium jicamae]MBR0939384.1 hypothetical protein [Bradyrhizobium jicamae]